MNGIRLRLLNYQEKTAKTSSGNNSAIRETAFVPKLVFKPQHRGETVKIAIFAALHGSEPSGTRAAFELARWAWSEPEELQGFELHIYPIGNPSCQKLINRYSRRALNFDRKFWSGSREPEIQYLERELWREAYDGIISVHADHTSDRFDGVAAGTGENSELLTRALAAAAEHLSLADSRLTDSLLSAPGTLLAPPTQSPRPLEVVLQTPALAPMDRQIAAIVSAVKVILADYPQDRHATRAAS